MTVRQDELRLIVEQGKKLGPTINKNRVIDDETNAHFTWKDMCKRLNQILHERQKEELMYGEVVTHPHKDKVGFGDPNKYGVYCGGNLDAWVDIKAYEENEEKLIQSQIQQRNDAEKVIIQGNSFDKSDIGIKQQNSKDKTGMPYIINNKSINYIQGDQKNSIMPRIDASHFNQKNPNNQPFNGKVLNKNLTNAQAISQLIQKQKEQKQILAANNQKLAYLLNNGQGHQVLNGEDRNGQENFNGLIGSNNVHSFQNDNQKIGKTFNETTQNKQLLFDIEQQNQRKVQGQGGSTFYKAGHYSQVVTQEDEPDLNDFGTNSGPNRIRASIKQPQNARQNAQNDPAGFSRKKMFEKQFVQKNNEDEVNSSIVGGQIQRASKIFSERESNVIQKKPNQNMKSLSPQDPIMTYQLQQQQQINSQHGVSMPLSVAKRTQKFPQKSAARQLSNENAQEDDDQNSQVHNQQQNPSLRNFQRISGNQNQRGRNLFGDNLNLKKAYDQGNSKSGVSMDGPAVDKDFSGLGSKKGPQGGTQIGNFGVGTFYIQNQIKPNIIPENYQKSQMQNHERQIVGVRISSSHHKKSLSTTQAQQQPQRINQAVGYNQNQFIQISGSHIRQPSYKGSNDRVQQPQRQQLVFPVTGGAQQIGNRARFVTSNSPPERPLSIHNLLKNNFIGQQGSNSVKPQKISSVNFNAYTDKQ